MNAFALFFLADSWWCLWWFWIKNSNVLLCCLSCFSLFVWGQIIKWIESNCASARPHARQFTPVSWLLSPTQLSVFCSYNFCFMFSLLKIFSYRHQFKLEIKILETIFYQLTLGGCAILGVTRTFRLFNFCHFDFCHFDFSHFDFGHFDFRHFDFRYFDFHHFDFHHFAFEPEISKIKAVCVADPKT